MIPDHTRHVVVKAFDDPHLNPVVVFTRPSMIQKIQLSRRIIISSYSAERILESVSTNTDPCSILCTRVASPFSDIQKMPRTALCASSKLATFD